MAGSENVPVRKFVPYGTRLLKSDSYTRPGNEFHVFSGIFGVLFDHLVRIFKGIFCPQLIISISFQYEFKIVNYNTMQCNTIHCNTIKYNTIQYNTIQYNTSLLCNTLSCVVSCRSPETATQSPAEKSASCILRKFSPGKYSRSYTVVVV